MKDQQKGDDRMNAKQWAAFALAAAAGLSACKHETGENSGGKTIPQRDEIAAEYRWDLASMYENNAVWEKDFAEMEAMLPKFESFKGKLTDGKKLLEALKLRDKVSARIDKLYVYAHLQKDLDTRISENQALADRIATLENSYREATSWLTPELLTIPEADIEKIIKATEGLALYERFFKVLNRSRKHILNDREEALLAMSGNVTRSAGRIFEALTTADIEFPTIEDENGEKVQLSYGRYSKMLENKNPDVRRRAFEGMYGTFEKFQNTNATIFDANLKGYAFIAKARNYESSLEMALSPNNIPVSVYEKLIAATHENIEPLRRYMKLRKKALGLKDLHLYDTSVSFVKGGDREYPYEEAKATILEALHPLGKAYTEEAHTVFNSRWVDVYETQGKTNGAYSWGTYEAHPFILMNYNESRDHMFTLAHELGHAMHSLYSNRTQPYIYADYTIFVAEVASTLNENLLLDYLLKKAANKDEKLALLDQWANNIVGTFYTQVLFAEFEKAAHDLVAQGVPVTADKLNETYFTILKSFYGDALILDEAYKLTWGRISHFYSPFYVYQYATSIAASTYLYQKIAEGDTEATEKYLTLLKSGGNDDPIELLKKAGVDMSSPEPVQHTLQKFDWVLTEMEKLLGNDE